MIEDLVPDIVEATSVGNYRLELNFSDGFKRVVDFGYFLQKASHPDIRKYLDPRRFAEFTIEGGNLVWNDYELCFPLGDLYKGIITAPVSDVLDSYAIKNDGLVTTLVKQFRRTSGLSEEQAIALTIAETREQRTQKSNVKE